MWYRQGVDKGYSEGHDLGFSEGRDLGFNEGHDLGFNEDRELMRELAKRLSEQGRTEEFAQAMSDEALLAKLVKEFGLEHLTEA